MGDKVYPGFALMRVKKALSIEACQEVVLRKLGGDCWRCDRIHIQKIETEDRPNATFIITGCTLTFDEIRRRMFGYSEGLFNACMMDKDFGIPRTNTGAFVGMSIDKELHEDLVRARQHLPIPPIFILPDVVNKQLGGLINLENVILFDAGIKEINKSMLKGKLMVFGASDGSKGENKQGRNKYDRTSITYVTRFDALQQLCELNGNPRFSRERKCFLMDTDRDGKKETRRCAIPYRGGLGPEDEWIDSKYYMESFGYIPLDKLDPAFFDIDRMKFFLDDCYMCDEKYELLGIDAEFNWIAGRCGCLVSSDRNDWNNQPFIKLSFLPSQLRSQNKYLSTKTKIRACPYLDGITPQYEDPNHFQATALQAFKIAHTHDARRMLIDGHCLGFAESSEFVDVYETEGGKKYEVFCVKLVVPKNKFWNKDTNQAVAKTNLIRRKFTSWPKRLTPAELKRNNISGRLHSVVERFRKKHECVLTVVAYVPNKEKIEKGEEFVVVPKPPKCEISRAKRLTAQWKSFAEKRAICMPQIKATVRSSAPINYSRDTERQRAFKIEFSLDEGERISVLQGLEKSIYVGMDAILKVKSFGEKRLMKVPFRVFSACEDDDAPTKTVVTAVGFVHPLCEILIGEVVDVEFWCISRNDWEGMSTATSSGYSAGLPADWQETDEEEEEEEDKNDDQWDLDPLEEDDEDEVVSAPPEQPNEEDEEESRNAPFLYHYVLKDGDPREIRLEFDPIEKFVAGMMRRPVDPDFTNLDYLLYPDNHIQHQIEPLLTLPRNQFENQEKIEQILMQLNRSQYEAVNKMAHTRLSIIQGPPGTGKTSTASLGVCLLHCLEEGLIVATASSNEAADVMFERIKRDNARLGVGMKVMRMYAASKESSVSDAELDDTILHHAMQKHPEWRKEKHIAELIDIRAMEGTARMTERQKKSLMTHIRRIQMKILRKQDVVVCTVGSMADGRIPQLRESFVKKGSGVLAVFVDEASLLTLPSTLAPLTLGSSRIVILGDFLQLPPCVDAASAQLAGLHISWMDLLNLIPYVKQEDAKGNKKVFTMLDTQYRMHDRICTLVSELTYQGKLTTASSVLNRDASQFSGALNALGLEVVGITYDGNKNEEPEGTSYYNPKELEIVFALLYKLKELKVPLDRVTVIGMYEPQVRRLKTGLADTTGLDEVTIATVDSYQGKENGIVIVSLVRSNDAGNIGFMVDQRRLNVAISRAMYQLIIVGDFASIRKSQVPFWKKVFDYCEQNGVVKKDHEI